MGGFALRRKAAGVNALKNFCKQPWCCCNKRKGKQTL